MKIQFQGRDRETRKSVEYYNYVLPYQYHKTSLDDGTIMYSFSLEPNLLQPTGSANLSKIETVHLVIELNNKLLEFIRRNMFSVRVGTYATTYNILRIMSGISGLAWLNI
jgi:hypothetical protein